MLFTCSKKKTKSDSAISYSIAPTFIQASVPSLNFKTTLGPLDTLFTNVSSVFVELLLIFNKSSINPTIFQQAVSNALTDFPSMCGRRIGTTIAGAQGVRFSAITTSLNSLISKPPSKDIFDTPLENEVVTLRLATTEHNEMSGIGLVFDHALSDISGIALLLSHISYQYVELTSKMTEDVNTDLFIVVFSVLLKDVFTDAAVLEGVTIFCTFFCMFLIISFVLAIAAPSLFFIL